METSAVKHPHTYTPGIITAFLAELMIGPIQDTFFLPEGHLFFGLITFSFETNKQSLCRELLYSPDYKPSLRKVQRFSSGFMVHPCLYYQNLEIEFSFVTLPRMIITIWDLASKYKKMLPWQQ